MRAGSKRVTTNVATTAYTPRRSGAMRRRIVAIFAGWMTLCWTIIGSLVWRQMPGGWLTLLLALVISVAPLGLIARWFGGHATPGRWARLLVIRPFWYVQLALPLLAIGGLAGIVIGLPWGASGTVGRTLLLVVGAVVALGILAGYLGARRLVTRQITVQIPDLPAALVGLRIVQLSDLHVGPHTSRRFLKRIMAAVRSAKADLIVLTGDQVDDHVTDVAPFGAAFGGLSAPLGVVAIAGNHDVYAGWPPVRAGMEQLGFRVLVNEAIPMTYQGATFWLAGTGDPAGLAAHATSSSVAPNIEQTLAAVPPHALTIALAHNPALWPQLAERGVALTLSGHTHHGQFAIPWLRWSLASWFLEYAMGDYRQGDSLLYINPGTNFWGIPFRLGTPPEVTVLTLQAGEAWISSQAQMGDSVSAGNVA